MEASLQCGPRNITIRDQIQIQEVQRPFSSSLRSINLENLSEGQQRAEFLWDVVFVDSPESSGNVVLPTKNLADAQISTNEVKQGRWP